MNRSKILVGTVVTTVVVSATVLRASLVTYQSGFESSGEQFGTFTIGDTSGNGWSMKGGSVITNAPNPTSFSGSQALFLDGNNLNPTTKTNLVVPSADPASSIYRISFDLYSPAFVERHTFQVLGQYVEMDLQQRSSNPNLAQIKLTGPNGLGQEVRRNVVPPSIGSQFSLNSNIWYHIDMEFLAPGQNSFYRFNLSQWNGSQFSNVLSEIYGVSLLNFGRTNVGSSGSTPYIFFFDTFTSIAGDGDGLYIDNLEVAIPEPSSLALLGLLALFGFLRRRR